MVVDESQKHHEKKRFLKDWLYATNPLTKDAEGEGSPAGLRFVLPQTVGISSLPDWQMQSGQPSLRLRLINCLNETQAVPLIGSYEWRSV